MPTPLFINTRRERLSSGLVRGVNDLSAINDPEYSLTDIQNIELFATAGADGLEDWSGAADRTIEVAIGQCGIPTGGTFTLEGGGASLELTSTTISATATPEQVKDAIVANSNATASDVEVTGIPGFWRIAFVDALSDTAIAKLTADGSGLTPSAVAGVFVEEGGGGGDDAVQQVSLGLQPLAYTDDFDPNADEDGWVGKLRFNGRLLTETIKQAGTPSIVSELVIRVTSPGGDPFTYARRSIRINCQIIPMEAFADPPGMAMPGFYTKTQIDAFLTGGILEAIFSSITLQEPGIWTYDEAEAELDEGDVLHVPSPGKGNVLLVRRQESPAGGDEIASFTGLVAGTIYYLVHDDAGAAIEFAGYEITDNQRPLAIRAISETEAVPFVTEPKA